MQNCRDVKNVVGAAIESLKDSVRWRRGKDTVHLRKRKLLGHLPVEATLDVYNGLIRELMDQPQSKVYAYRFRGRVYGVVVGEWRGEVWLAIFTTEGIMETAFPPDDVALYIRENDMRLLGTVEEIAG